MKTNFHESNAKDEIKSPSERSTGLTFAVVAVIVAVLWRDSSTVPWVALGVAAILAAVSLITPGLLKPVNILWFRLGLFLHRIVNPIAMFAVFALVFVPAGFIMRFWRDPLGSKRATVTSTYWIEREGTTDTERSMTNQF